MKGDFSRLMLNGGGRYSRVLVQQGRPQLDWDLNALGDVVLQQLRRFAVDLGGAHFAPAGSTGFSIESSGGSFDNPRIREGRYYVEGLACDCEAAVLHADQPYGAHPEDADIDGPGNYVVALEAWERFVSHHEDPELREIALGGPDTTGRTQVAWRVRVLKTEADVGQVQNDFHGELRKLLPELDHAAHLSARAARESDDAGPCERDPLERYRATENQLYRVEIHRGGRAASAAEAQQAQAGPPPDAVATFKWSRENGSVVFRVEAQVGRFLVLDGLGRDDRLGLRAGDWVEVFEPRSEQREEQRRLVRVAAVEPAERRIQLEAEPGPLTGEGPTLVRRWDQRAGSPGSGGLQLWQGAALVRQDVELQLEQGVKVTFHTMGATPAERYRAGDHWLIPARAVRGDVLWPRQQAGQGDPVPLPPHGPARVYAPLLFIEKAADGTETPHPLRRQLQSLPLA